MKAYVMYGPREGRVVEIDSFPPGAGDVLLRTKAVAICTTERRIYDGALKIPYPVIGGHEVSAVVESPADGLGFAPGDHVVIDAVMRCGHCRFCVRGQSNLCPSSYNSKRGEYRIVGGGFADHITIAGARLVQMNPAVSHEEAALTEPLACALHSVKQSRITFGDTVAIIGAGTMGALHVLIAKRLGATVFVSDPDPKRLELAARLGADHVLDPRVEEPSAFIKARNDGRLADAVFIAASVKVAGQQALTMVEKAGRVVFFAATHPPETLEVDWNLLHHKEVSLVGSVSKVEDDFRQAAALLSNRSIDVRPLVSKTIGIDELSDELGGRPSGDVQRVVVAY